MTRDWWLYLLLAIALGLLAVALSECKKLEVEDVSGCVRFDTEQLENIACIEGVHELCRCPSEDSSVQAQCDLWELPDRDAPPSECEE